MEAVLPLSEFGGGVRPAESGLPALKSSRLHLCTATRRASPAGRGSRPTRSARRPCGFTAPRCRQGQIDGPQEDGAGEPGDHGVEQPWGRPPSSWPVKIAQGRIRVDCSAGWVSCNSSPGREVRIGVPSIASSQPAQCISRQKGLARCRRVASDTRGVIGVHGHGGADGESGGGSPGGLGDPTGGVESASTPLVRSRGRRDVGRHSDPGAEQIERLFLGPGGSSR